MYLDFFSFEHKPFDITPDTRFFYLSPQHEEVIETLLYGVRARRGFMVFTGEVGTGKTTSLRALMNRIHSEGKENADLSVETSLVLNPLLSTLDLIKTINRDFGIEGDAGDSIQEHINILNVFLLARAREGKNALVIIDEAQDLSLDALEMVRLLSNLETETHKLLQIILTGQPELDRKLNQNILRQLRQRIQISYHLNPLKFEETKAYIMHRLKSATPKCCLIFRPAAFRKIFQYTGGIPRLINNLCELALMSAYMHDTHIITGSIVENAFSEMSDKSWANHGSFWKRLWSPKKGEETRYTKSAS